MKVAAADGYTNSFPWESGRWLGRMSEIESQLDLCGVDLTEICKEDYKNLVAEFHLVENVQFIFLLWVKFIKGM
jgi:hypothetical protein